MSVPLSVRVDQNILTKHASIGLTVQITGNGSMHGGGVIIAHWRMAASCGECGVVSE